jgi:hypothetical protein
MDPYLTVGTVFVNGEWHAILEPLVPGDIKARVDNAMSLASSVLRDGGSLRVIDTILWVLHKSFDCHHGLVQNMLMSHGLNLATGELCGPYLRDILRQYPEYRVPKKMTAGLEHVRRLLVVN